MSFKPLNPTDLPKPIAPYSMGTRAGDTVYVSGVLALDNDGKTVGVGDVRAQTRHVIETIKKILGAGGATLRDVAFNTVICCSTSRVASSCGDRVVQSGATTSRPPYRRAPQSSHTEKSNA